MISFYLQRGSDKTLTKIKRCNTPHLNRYGDTVHRVRCIDHYLYKNECCSSLVPWLIETVRFLCKEQCENTFYIMSSFL